MTKNLTSPTHKSLAELSSHHQSPCIALYQVLGLSLQSVQLFEGNRDAIVEIDVDPGVPRTIVEALGEKMNDPGSTHHGQGGKNAEADQETERFFRAVDRAVLIHHSQPSGLPLILAALPMHHNVFRKVSHNSHLMAEGLSTNPNTLSIDELRKLAWQVFERQ